MILVLDTSSLVKLYVEQELASFVSLRRRLPRRGIAFSSFDRRRTGAARRARWPLR